MDTLRFDDLARLLGRTSGRRRLVLGLAGSAVGLTAGGSGEVAARKRKRKVRFNAFGCVDVGRSCTSADQCCSGICRGKKGKKRCKAHDTGGCRPGIQDTTCGTDANPGTNVPCTTASGNPNGLCGTTTGNAGYCLQSGECRACARDAECREFCQDERAACIRCDDCPETGGTSCAGPSGSPC